MSTQNPHFSLRMTEEEQLRAPIDVRSEREAAGYLARIGKYDSVDRFIRKYGNVRTRRVYLSGLLKYLTWLREVQGVQMDPDAMAADNLKCVYGNEAQDVRTKRKHTDLLDRFVNEYLVSEGLTEPYRVVLAAAVQQFYRRNDSPLFGDFQVSHDKPRTPPKPLKAEDIRKVLKAMPLTVRTPLLLVWQSGMEINRVLSLRWGQVQAEEIPLRLDFVGRKKHKKPYGTFLGRDSVQHLRLWRTSWAETFGKEPAPSDLIFMSKRGPVNHYWLNKQMARYAKKLNGSGLLENGNPSSWHTHALRHSFETEASHAGVKAEVRDFFLGHLAGVQWVYNHRDELHPQDLKREYLRIEPYVSLDETETTLRDQYEV